MDATSNSDEFFDITARFSEADSSSYYSNLNETYESYDYNYDYGSNYGQPKLEVDFPEARTMNEMECGGKNNDCVCQILDEKQIMPSYMFQSCYEKSGRKAKGSMQFFS